MLAQTLVLVRPTREVPVNGTRYNATDVAGFAPAIAAKLVRQGSAIYVDAEGEPCSTPVTVEVARPSSGIV